MAAMAAGQQAATAASSAGGQAPGMRINLKNNCTICLLPEEPAKMLEILQKNPRNLRTFQPIVHYLTGTDPTYGKSQEECRTRDIPVMKNLPPLCSYCYDITADIYRLHAELLENQLLIQSKTEQVRRLMAETRRSRGYERSRKTRLLERLEKSKVSKEQVGMMKKFLENFHGRAVTQGGKKVIFPSHPPPNFLPLPKAPPQVILLQLPVQQIQQPASTSSIEASTSTLMSPFTTSVARVPTAVTTHPSALGTAPITSIIQPKQNVPSISTNNSSTANTAKSRTAKIGGHSTISKKIPGVAAATPKAISSCSSSNVVLIPGHNNAVKYENEMEDEELDGDHNFLRLSPEITIKEEYPINILPDIDLRFRKAAADSDEDWEMKEDDDNDEDTDEGEDVPKYSSARKAKSKRQPQSAILTSRKRKQVEAPSPAEPVPTRFSSPSNKQSQKNQKTAPSEKPRALVECDICDYRLHPVQLRSHIRVHLRGKEGHPCSSCKKTYISKSLLIQHQNHSSFCKPEPPNSADHTHCSNCPSPTSTSLPSKKFTLSELRSHVFYIHEKDSSLDRVYACPICGDKFRTEEGLDFHLNIHLHKNQRSNSHLNICPPGTKYENQRFNCDICQLLYFPTHLKDHFIQGHGIPVENLIKCSLCPLTSSQVDTHLHHLASSHATDRRKKPCHICDNSFEEASQIRIHLFHKHGLGVLIDCEKCDKRFLERNALNEHMKECH